MSEGGQVAVRADEDVVAVIRARGLEQRVRELERLWGRKTEAFVKTLRRDYARIYPRPDLLTVLNQLPVWIEDYNENHPHRGLRMRSPREFIQSQSQPASCPISTGATPLLPNNAYALLACGSTLGRRLHMGDKKPAMSCG